MMEAFEALVLQTEKIGIKKADIYCEQLPQSWKNCQLDFNIQLHLSCFTRLWGPF